MNCPMESRENADLLLDYCARRLEPEIAVTLERHFAVCPSCRGFAESQRAVWNALDAWEALPVSSDFDRRLYARIEREVSWWDRLIRPFRPLLIHRGLPIAATAGLVIMAGMLLDRPRGEVIQTETVQADQVERALQDMELLRDFSHRVRADATQTPM